MARRQYRFSFLNHETEKHLQGFFIFALDYHWSEGQGETCLLKYTCIEALQYPIEGTMLTFIIKRKLSEFTLVDCDHKLKWPYIETINKVIGGWKSEKPLSAMCLFLKMENI